MSGADVNPTSTPGVKGGGLNPTTPVDDAVALAPGSHLSLDDRWGRFDRLVRTLPPGALVLVDRKVARLHPGLIDGLRQRKPLRIVQLTAGERAKSLGGLEKVASVASRLPRNGLLLCIGGGTLGDLATTSAHLIKRGLRLWHVPTTVLAAVDSSVGGKGAVHVEGPPPVKNALGAFHYAERSWLCPELFETLTPTQVREGSIEAWKMALTLDAEAVARWSRRPPPLQKLIREARALKASVCVRDPYEQRGLRQVLNFGHTFGHAIESLTGFRVSHGDAVGLGMLCALDVGRETRVTPELLAEDVESLLLEKAGVQGRQALARALRKATPDALTKLLAADKKNERAGELKMVLLPGLGRFTLVRVSPESWRPLLEAWRAGARP